MNKQLLIDGLLWGFLLWLVGYILGIALFPFVSTSIMGWVITPFGILITLWVLFKIVHSTSFMHYLKIGSIWVSMAIVLDYFLLVKIFNPPDGYYKLDVYLYYTLTFLLPLLVGWKKSHKVS